MMTISTSRAYPHQAPQRLMPRRSPIRWLGDMLAPLARFAARNSAMAATIAVLAGLCGLQALALLRAPAAWMPSSIAIHLAAGDSITLGQRELAAPQTDRNHLSLHRGADGGWTIRNLSATRQIVLLRGQDEQRTGSMPLQNMQRFQIDGALFDIASANGRSVTFHRDGHAWRYDGAVLYRDGQQQANCPESHVASKLLSAWNRVMPLALTISRPLTFGGNLYCDNRLGIAQVTPGAAQIARINGQLQLSAGNPDGDRAAVIVTGKDGVTDLRKQEAALEGVSAIIAGHTRFQLDASGDMLTLTPSRHVKLFSEPEQGLPEQVSWQWQARSLWHESRANPAWIAIALCLACSAALAVARQFPTQRLANGCALTGAASLLIAGAIALAAQRAGYAPSAFCSLMLGASALLLWLLLPGRLSLLTAASVILLAAGLLVQLELGLGAVESSWLRYYQKSAALLAVGCGLGGMLLLWARHQAARGTHMKQITIEWLLALFAAVALAALAAEVLWGDETGVFDLQPVELAKLALTMLTAHCLALRFNWHNGPHRLAEQGARWLRLIAPALLFIALTGLALVQVDDFSPLILLLVWSTCMAFAYAIAARHRLLGGLLIAMALLAAAAITWLRLTGTDDLIRWGFYADRFLVWLNPAEHPHTGQQLLLGARAIAEGGWLGIDHWLGLRALGLSAGSVIDIPAVQDDFAASFFLNRHGLAGGLLLWCVQAAFLTGLLQAALNAYREGASARNFRQAWSGRFRYFVLCGGGAFVLGHFLLSWGTNLAIFPIMGQPMSFLSAGGSHLLFFLCPLLTFSAISASSSEGV